MTIHTGHPFASPDADRDQLRRFRGRMALPVTIWTIASAGRRAGWTVSSALVAAGDPGEVLGLVDEDSDLADLALGPATVAVSLLGPEHRHLADVFAGLAPAPGGPFRVGSWTDTPYGPVLDGAVGWLGARLHADPPGHAGWTLLLRGTVERVEIGGGNEVLGYLGGRYRSLPLDTRPDSR